MHPLTIVVTAILISRSQQLEQPTTRRLLIDLINQNQTSWTAGENFPENVTTESLKRLNGALGLHPDPNFQLEVKHHKVARKEIPQFFDAREQWSECSDVIATIRNQGRCGSCWAFASAETMADRLCIASGGKTKFQFSPQDLLECCKQCVPQGYDKCDGGYLVYAYDFWLSDGIVSGGDYIINNYTGCKPYSYNAFEHGLGPTTCQQKCHSLYNTSYNDDKKFGKQVYQIGIDEAQIQTEIMTNGPVTAMYVVYEDFYYYKSGVYRHTIGNSTGNHAVKIVGWGTEAGLPYWLVANSWGTDWGDLNGFFKILRGQNHCKIEESITAGKSSSAVYRAIPGLFIFIIMLKYSVL